MNREQFFEYISGKTLTFCGIGRSHMPLIELFSKKGAIVSARDKRSFEALGEDGKKLEALGIKLILGEDYLSELNEDIIFRTPGMRYYLPELVRARENGSAVTSETELFFDLCPCKIYAITGSDGKTTTTSLIAEMLKAAGKTVHLGGNIGKPLLPEIAEIKEDDVAVVELSSFQLISMRKSPEVAVVTNVSPNHLDIHKDMQEYIDSKKNVFLHQNAFSRTVLNADNEITAGFTDEVRGDTWLFSRKEKPSRGIRCDGETIFVNGAPLMKTSDIKIPGWHNVENYMAAIAAVWGEVSSENIIKVAKEFGGVEHRAEFVRELDGVSYFNDSIASSPTRTISGTLSLYSERLILICGGYDKNIPYEPLGPVINDKVKVLILLGATGPKIESAVRNATNFDENNLKIVKAQTMEEAVALARENAVKGDRIYLSPASASFDMYKDFEERGNHFKKIVKSL